MTKLVNDSHLRSKFPEVIDKELVPKYWSNHNEDAIWCDCPSNPEYSGFYYYASLQDWSIE